MTLKSKMTKLTIGKHLLLLNGFIFTRKKNDDADSKVLGMS